uniref:fimbrial protein n=1 Tax=Castellaniella defragrans TaxID=75697 RepID=UPI003342B0B6
MQSKALFVHTARRIRAWGGARGRAVFAQSCAALCLLALDPATAHADAYCTIGGTRSYTIEGPEQIEVTPQGTISDQNRFTFAVPGSGDLNIAGCTTEALYDNGGLVNIPVYLYLDDHFIYRDPQTIEIEDSGFGLRISPSSERSFRNAPLRLHIGEITEAAGGGVSYQSGMGTSGSGEGGGNAATVQLDLVVLNANLTRESEGVNFGGLIFAESYIRHNPSRPGVVSQDPPEMALVKVMNNLAMIPVVQRACEASTTTFNLGKRGMGVIVGYTSPAVLETVQLTNCPVKVPISYQITPDTEVVPLVNTGNSLIKLDSTTSGAEGVAIQLLYGDGTTPHPLGEWIKLPESPLTTDTAALMLGARYMQVESKVKNGRAESSATITFNYE